jgi:uncharacterized RDD family membrane protein YckC
MICRNHLDVTEGLQRCTRCGQSFCRDCLVDIHGHPFCATCKSEEVLDIASGVELPAIGYVLATRWRRFFALLLDSLITAIPSVLVAAIIALLGSGQFEQNYAQLSNGAIFPIYEALCMAVMGGQTFGKRMLGIRVVRADGNRVSTGQAWARAIVRLVAGALCLIDYVPVFFTPERKCVHDMAAGTRVIREQ